MWAMCFAAYGRVGSIGLDAHYQKSPTDLPTCAFIPGKKEYSSLREKMLLVIKYVIIQRLEAFSGLGTKREITHERATEMSQKSEMVCI